MADIFIPNTVSGPSPASYGAVPPLNFAPITQGYQEGQKFQQDQAVKKAFQGGLPTDANGNPDFQAAAMKLYQLGAPDQAAQMLQTGMAQQAFSAARQELGTPMTPPVPAAPVAQPSTASAPASPINNNAPGPQGDYYSTNHALESGGNPTAHNPDAGAPGTAAYGLAGFMPGTWAHLVQANPDLNLPPDITKSTREQQIAASRALTGENAGYLAQNGIPITDRTARIANFLGAGGAVHFFTALAQNPAAPAASLFPKEARANPDAFYAPDGKTPRTLAQLFQYETTILPQMHGLPPLGTGNTTGFNYSVTPRNQVAGPGAPSAGGPLAYAADGTPVQTDAQGNAINPQTGQPTAAIPRGTSAPPIPVSAANAAAQAQQIASANAPQNSGNVGTLGAAPAGIAAANGPSSPTWKNWAAGKPPGVAQGDASERSSYAENLSRPPPSNPVGGSQGGAPVAPAPPLAGAGSQVAGGPPSAGGPLEQAAPPVAQQSVKPSTKIGLMDPTLAGLVPQGWDPGAYAAALYKRAGVLSLSPATKGMGDAYKDQADKVMAAVTASVTSRSPALQEWQLNAQQKPDGTWETPGETQARIAGDTETSKLKAQNEQTLKEVQPTPGGPKQFDTTAHLIQAIKDGRAGANASVGPGAGSPPGGGGIPPGLPVAEQPKFIADRQAEIAKDEGAMMSQYQARQIAKERLGELADLTETYQTGDLNAAKAKMQALAAAWGIKIPNSATMNAAAYEEFTKNAIGNVFSQAKDLGGRILVTELTGLTKANANAELQPAAAAKIIAQGAGILNYEDKHFEDYHAWKDKNQNAFDTSPFEIPFIKGNPVKRYTDDASQQIAPLGVDKPKSPADLKVGQVYQSPNGHGIGRWDGKQFIPEPRPASLRLFRPNVSVSQ